MGTGDIISEAVPEGYIWVVRCIDASSPPNSMDVYSNTPNGLLINDAVSVIINYTPPEVRWGVSYHWEGRQVLNYGQVLVASSLDEGWNVRISGYQLTSP